MGPGGGSARCGRTAPFAWPRDVGLVGSHLVLAGPKVTFPTNGAQAAGVLDAEGGERPSRGFSSVRVTEPTGPVKE